MLTIDAKYVFRILPCLVILALTSCASDLGDGKMSEAQALLMAGKNEKAIDAYSEAILMSPNEWKAYANRGIAYDEIGKHKKAIADFDKAISLCPEGDPYYHENFYNRAVAYSRIKKPYQAILDFSQAIKIAPDPSQFSLRGQEYLKLDKYEKARKDFSMAIVAYGAHPATPDLFYLLALTEFKAGKKDEAAKELKRAFGGYKKYGDSNYIPDAYNLKSLIESANGNEKAAKLAAAKAKDLGYKPGEDKLGIPVLGNPKKAELAND